MLYSKEAHTMSYIGTIGAFVSLCCFAHGKGFLDSISSNDIKPYAALTIAVFSLLLLLSLHNAYCAHAGYIHMRSKFTEHQVLIKKFCDVSAVVVTALWLFFGNALVFGYLSMRHGKPSILTNFSAIKHPNNVFDMVESASFSLALSLAVIGLIATVISRICLGAEEDNNIISDELKDAAWGVKLC
jgi:hypothetical protein